jgi:DNA-binding response OmpR family regulator
LRNRPRVLIVDDDTEIVQAVVVRLGAAGYDVTTAADGEQGFERALETRPHVIVMDIQMPTMDGLTALARIHAHSATRSTPVVVLSACSSTRKHALELGARYFLDKPYNAKTLVAAVESSLLGEVAGVESA